MNVYRLSFDAYNRQGGYTQVITRDVPAYTPTQARSKIRALYEDGVVFDEWLLISVRKIG